MLERFTWFKQSGYRYDGDGLTVYIDPWDVTGDGPPADVVFITHAHDDHYSPDDLEKIRKDDTVLVAPRDFADELSGNVTAVSPGDSLEAGGVQAHVVPAYNIVEERLEMHPKAKGWVGYLLTLGGTSYFHAGDTDALPELESLPAKVTFLPVGGTFTMDAGEAAGLAKKISPEIAVPMHYGFFDGAGTPADAETFKREAVPVRVEILIPENDFDFT